MFRRNDDDEWSNEIYAISLVESSGDDRKDKYRERGELCESWPCRHTACPDCIQSWRGRPDKPFRNKLIKTIAVKARGLASFGWKVTSHRIKVACNRVRKLAGERASLIKKKKKKTTRTCLDEIVNWIIALFSIDPDFFFPSSEWTWNRSNRKIIRCFDKNLHFIIDQPCIEFFLSRYSSKVIY